MKNIELFESVALTEGDGHNWGTDGPLVIYDGYGLEGESEPQEKSFSCNACGERKTFDLRGQIGDVNYYRNWSDHCSPEDFEVLVKGMDLKVKESLNRKIYLSELDMSPYFQVFECESCLNTFMFCMGYDEKQPGRYVAHLQGLKVCKIDALPDGAEMK